MPKYKKEAVTVSFHYLVRQTKDAAGEIVQEGFTKGEFDALTQTLSNLPPIDLDDEKVQHRVRIKKAVPIEDVEPLNDRTLFGVYRAAYWGHAYENTVVGKVPADSLNLRKFYFIAYLAQNGRIYLGVQYLGKYGSYEGLKNTILSFLPNAKNIVPHSFRQDSAMFEDVDPSELHVTVARKSEDIASPSSIGSEAIVAFKKKRKDEEFGKQVKRRLLPTMGTDLDRIRKAASAIVNDSGLMEITDEDIADCSIIGRVHGKRKKIYMISQGVQATQFNIVTSYNEDGHPTPDSTREKMMNLLEKRIISVLADA